MTDPTNINHYQKTNKAPSSHRYSRFVGLMKLVLPTFAIALVALMAVWPGSFGDGGGFRLSFEDLARDPNNELGVTRARFAGIDSNSRPFLITAERAVQQSVKFQVFNLDNLQADLTLDNGTWISISAISGILNRDKELLNLEGPIEIFTDIGYELHAQEAVVDLSTGLVETSKPIHGHGPLGRINSKGMKFMSEGGLIHFTRGVHVILNNKAS